MHLRTVAGSAFLLFIALCVPAEQAGNESYRFASGGSTAIPIELTQNVVFFQATLKGSNRPLWLSLDSGSGSTYLDEAVAGQLGLKTSGGGSVHGAGSGEVPVQYVDGVTFELPGLEVRSDRINITNLKPLNEQLGRTEDGFLGYDFLSRFVVTVDYAAGKLTIYDPATFKYSGAGEILPLTFKHHWPYVHGTIKVKGVPAQSGEFLVDSGSGDAVDHPAILKSTAPLRKIQTGVGLGTPTEGALGRAEYFVLGNYRLSAPIVSCCSANPDDQEKIGGEVLRRFRVIFDYPHGRIILERGAHFSEPFPNA